MDCWNPHIILRLIGYYLIPSTVACASIGSFIAIRAVYVCISLVFLCSLGVNQRYVDLACHADPDKLTPYQKGRL